MSYSLWCGGELVGHTELDFEGLNFVRCRSGHFHPTERGVELMPELAVKSMCMRAYMHRHACDAVGNPLAHPMYIGSSMFADVSEALQRVAQRGLELRDANNVVVPTGEIGIQDKRGDWPENVADDDDLEVDGTEADEVAPDFAFQLECEINGGLEQNHAQRDAYRLKQEPDEQTAAEMAEEEAELMELEGYDPDNSFWTELDLSGMISFCSDVDDEWGMGWNPDLMHLNEHPRYQVHVMLLEPQENAAAVP